MLILLPPSETKAQPETGSPVDLSALSFPELTEARETVLERLAEVSAREDALDLLKVGPRLTEEVRRNTRLRELPAQEALRVYTGVLYDALGYETLSAPARERARGQVLVVSALWGLLAPQDRVPAYRLSMGARLAPRGTLATWWRGELGPVLEERVGEELVIDCRSGAYQAAWKAPAEHTVAIRAERVGPGGQRTVVSHMAKHFRGLVARTVLEAAQDPGSPEELRELLATEHEVELEESGKGPAQLTVVVREG